MRSECNIIRDLLPLCIEDMASPDSAVFVGKHLEKCEECRKEMSRLKDPVLFEQAIHTPEETEALKALQEKLKRRSKILVTATTIVTAVVVSVLLICLILYHLPQRRQVSMPVCNAAGEVSYLEIDVNYYRRLFSTTWVEGTVTFDGVVYYDINSDWGVYSFWDWGWHLGDTKNLIPDNTIFRNSDKNPMNLDKRNLIVFKDIGSGNMFDTVIFYCLEGASNHATNYYGPASTAEEAQQVADDLGWYFN